MESRMIQVPGGRAEVQVFEGGEGEPLLFLHGAGGLMVGDPFFHALAGRFRVHAPLLPGYGDSGGEEDLRDMLDVTLHTFDVLEALGLEDPIVVGHSMGGMIAAEMAALAPNDISRLALIAPAGLWDDAHPIADLFAMLPREMPEYLFHDPEFGAKVMAAGLALDDPAFLQEFLVLRARRFGMAGKILFPIPERGLAQRLYRIRARTVIVWGENDNLIDVSYGDLFRVAIAGAELIRLPAAGHMVTLEQTEGVLSAIGGLAG